MSRRFLDVSSNWETVAFLLIDKIIHQDLSFSRRHLMSNKILEKGVAFTKTLGHKSNPKNPIQTLQKTIQNLRDKGVINFLGRGEYQLTAQGLDRMNEIKQEFKQYLEDVKDSVKDIEDSSETK